MTTGAWYRTGTIAVTNASATVAGTLTAWTNQVKAGDILFVGGVGYEVAAVVSNTELTLATAFAGATDTGLAYALARFSPLWSSVGDLAMQIADFTSSQIQIISGTGAPADAVGADGWRYFRLDAPEYYVKAGGSWGSAVPIQGPQGPAGPTGAQGPAGPANSLSIGTVTTGAAGSSAAASISGTAPTQQLSLTIPRGNTGAQGPQGNPGTPGAAATVGIGTVTTGAPGSSAAVTNGGTSSAAVFNFTIPRGADGAGLTPRGDYSGATGYVLRDVVTDQGSSWVALGPTTGNAPPTLPTTSNTYWQLVAQKGADGSGSVVSVNSVGPDVAGDITLMAEEIETALSPVNYAVLGSSIADHLAGIDDELIEGRAGVTTLASAATVDIGGASTLRVKISGTTTIASFGTIANVMRVVEIVNGLTVSNAAAALPGNAAIPAPAGSVLVLVSDDAGAWKLVGYQPGNALGSGGVSTPSAPQGRLTITSGEPVNVTNANAETLHYVPYVGGLVPIYDGAAWAMTSIGSGVSQAGADASKSPAAAVGGNLYDLFIWNDAGTVRLSRGPAWVSGTARGAGAGTTELDRVSGFLVNKYAITNGPAAQRGTYVGTARFDPGNAFFDAPEKRCVWNMYNRRPRTLALLITTDSWSYSTNAWRQVQGSSAYQVEVVVGIDEDHLSVEYSVNVYSSTTTFRSARVAVGLDGATPSDRPGGSGVNSQAARYVYGLYSGRVGLGFHYLAALEQGGGADTQTWYGDAGAPTAVQSGLRGQCFA